MQVIQQNISALRNLKTIIRNLPNTLFTQPCDVLQGATVGQHIRHIIEFYQAILDAPIATICYDERKRDKRTEVDADFAVSKLQELMHGITKINADVALYVKANYGLSDESSTVLQSSLMRELAYALDHNTHHLAIVKIALTSFSVFVEDDFGVAASTLRYRECAQ